MKRITSRENQIYRQCRRLQRKKYRDASGLFLIEGKKLVREAQQENRVQLVVFDEACDPGERKPSSVDRCQMVCMTHALFSTICDTKTSQGVLAVASRPEWRRQDWLGVPGSNLVILDRLQDPGNVGTILRTAEAAGYTAVCAMRGTADFFEPKTVRAAAGSLLRIPAIALGTAPQAVELLETAGKTIVVTDLRADCDYDDAALQQNIALVIGNEGRGVSDWWRRHAHIKVKIPMRGKVESLNAAVAAGLLMYQFTKKG